MQQGYFLAIAGNIGVGKTELTHRLSEELGWAAYYEPVIQNPYLDAFYENMSRWSFHLQIYFLSERFKAQVEIGKSALPFIQDRTIYEDAEIFARTLHEQGSMTEVDYENYTALFHVLIVVPAQARPDPLPQGQPGDADGAHRPARPRRASRRITIDYIARLNHAYDDWMRRARRETEVLEIDTDRVPLQGETPAFRGLVDEPQAPLPAPGRAAAGRRRDVR